MAAYPFQLSGGMCQRAMIAIALCCAPSLLIADEPTTALDVTTQAKILDLLLERQRQDGMAMIFITHDLGVVAQVADTIAVMNHGRIVEYGPSAEIFSEPQHSYTRSLLAASNALLSSLPKHPSRLAGRVEARPLGVGNDRHDTVCEGADAREPAVDASRILLDVKGLTKAFAARGRSLFGPRGEKIVAARDVSFKVVAGETFGLVGKSGSGKTTVGRCVARAIDPTSGTIAYRRDDGTVVDLAALGRRELRRLRPKSA